MCIIAAACFCFDTSNMNLGGAVRLLRARRRWTQEELAHRVGISTANLSRIETGKHGASETLKTLLAREFEMRVSELIAMTEGAAGSRTTTVSKGDDRNEHSLLSFYHALSVEKKALLISIAKLLVRSRSRPVDTD